jgi:hypothetical protein
MRIFPREDIIDPGKTYALVVSQGADNPELHQKSIRYLAGMTGSGRGGAYYSY